MPLIRFPTVKGLVFTIDLSKIADRENPRTIEAPLYNYAQEPIIIEWGDGEVSKLDVAQASNFPSHTYAEGAGEVFRVTVRSVTGHLPVIIFYNSSANLNITLAVTSVDHFAGWSGRTTPSGFASYAKNTSNLIYIDPRIIGLPTWNNTDGAHSYSGIEQPVESFCLDFMSQNKYLGALFGNTKVFGRVPRGFFKNVTLMEQCHNSFANTNISGELPEDLLDNNQNLNFIGSMFNGCTGLTTPYIFWNQDGTIDTEKHPNLTANNATNVYANCTSELRAQVPTAYGGTMTV